MNRRHFLYLSAVMVLMVMAMLAMGREPWCRCGYVKLWHGVVKSAENSQHLTDWYTFTHVIHGIVFYGALAWLTPRLTLAWRFVLGTAVEAGWEVVENTPFVIERYRTATIALDYYGDSVVNSLGDVLAEMAGFALAAAAPVWASVAVVVTIEALLVVAIRDNLTLNILMLVWPLESIKAWQAG